MLNHIYAQIKKMVHLRKSGGNSGRNIVSTYNNDEDNHRKNHNQNKIIWRYDTD